MASGMFDEEVLNVTLKFLNANRQDMVDADKLAAHLALNLDNVVRKGISAGNPVDEIIKSLQRLTPALSAYEKRFGNIASQAQAIRQAQNLIAKFTPQRLERMAETAAARIAETSGSAALRRELQKHGALIARQIATQEGRYERVTRGSNIGRGLFIDTETTGLNALKHQVVELTATLFSFNKTTGEIVNAAERTYHGLQQLSFQSKHQFLPTGLTASTLQSQAISTTMLRRLMQQADFLVAHNAQFDKKFVEKMVPQAAGMQWLDTMRGINWRAQGFTSRAQQDLLRGYGITPGEAHRSTADVTSAIKLLASRPPGGGPTNLSQLLGSSGPLAQSQQILIGAIKSLVSELESDIRVRLGEGRQFTRTNPRYERGADPENLTGAPGSSLSPARTGRYDNPRRLEPSASGASFQDMAMRYAFYALADLPEFTMRNRETDESKVVNRRSRRPVRSTDYGAVKGASEPFESTPGQLGQVAISLDAKLGTLSEFMRNVSLMSGPGGSTQLLNLIVEQQKYQERIQQQRGLEKGAQGPVGQKKDLVRSGDELALAVMRGVNTRLANERLNLPSSGQNLLEQIDPEIIKRRERWVSRLLTQPAAQPPRKSVYIAGPMRGIPELNFPEFDRTEALWRSRGFGVVNPAQLDREHGYVPTKEQTVFKDLSIEQAMSRDLPAVAGVNAIALMKGWEKSQGAKMELQHAIERRKEIYHAESGQKLSFTDIRNLGPEFATTLYRNLLPPQKPQPTPTVFRPTEIEAFVGKYHGKPSVEPDVVRTAAQMLNFLKEKAQAQRTQEFAGKSIEAALFPRAPLPSQKLLPAPRFPQAAPPERSIEALRFVRSKPGQGVIEAAPVTPSTFRPPVHPSGIPYYQELSSIMIEGQERIVEKRAEKERQKQKAEEDERRRQQAGPTEPIYRSVAEYTRRQKEKERLERDRQAEPSLRNFLSSDVGESTIEGTVLEWIRKKFRSNKAASDQQQRIFSNAEFAQQAGIGTHYPFSRAPIPEATTLKGSLKQDALEKKLKKLEDAFESASKVFYHYRDVLAQGKIDEIMRRSSSQEAKISLSQAGRNASLDAQAQRIEARRARIETLAQRRLQGTQSSYEAKVASLSGAELEAEARYDAALRRRARRQREYYEKRVKEEPGIEATSFEGLSQAEQQRPAYKAFVAEQEEKLRPATLALQRAQFQRKFQAGDFEFEEGSQAALQEFVHQQAITRFGEQNLPVTYLGKQTTTEQLRQDYEKRLTLKYGGKTAIQKQSEIQQQIEEDKKQALDQLQAQRQQVTNRRVLSDERTEEERRQNVAKTTASIDKINAESNKKMGEATKKQAKLEKEAHEAKLAYVKKEAAAVGGGGGRGTGTGGGGGGGGFGALLGGQSRSGGGFGIGLATLVGYDVAIKDFIKDSSIYAARTQMMEFATNQMAKTAGLNVDQVNAEVEAIKKLNVTTQTANSVVQRMMQSQVDLGKATQLVTVAQDLAAISGQDAMETIQRLMTSITTGYTRNLHMLGLQVTSTSALRNLKTERRAEGLKGEPTEQERRQALVNQILIEGAKIAGTYQRTMLTAGGQFAYLKKEALEASNAIGKEFLPAFTNIMSAMSGGLRYVQEHAEGFAKLTSVLAALGVTLNALGTASFLKFMLGVTPGGRAAKVITGIAGALGVGGGIATYMGLNQDKAAADASLAQKQQASLEKSIQELRKKRAELFAHKEDTEEWRTAQEANYNALKSFSDEQVETAKWLTAQFADQYEKRIQDLDEYTSAVEGRSGKLNQLLAYGKGLTGIGLPQDVGFGGVVTAEEKGRGVGALKVSTAKGLRDQILAEYIKKAQGQGISEEDITAEVARREAARKTDPTGVILNAAKQKANQIASAFSEARSELSKLETKYDPITGDISKRYRKALEDPTSKVLIDREEALGRAKEYFAQIDELKKKAMTPGPTQAADKAVYEEFKKTQPKGLIEKTEKDRQDLFKKVVEAGDIELDKIARQTQIQIAGIRQVTEEEKIKAQTIQGDYNSELEAIDKVLASRLKLVEADKKRRATLGVDRQAEVEKAQAEEQAAQDKIRLEDARFRASKQLLSEGVRRSVDIEAEDVLSAPGNAAEQIAKAYKMRLEATKEGTGRIEDDTTRYKAQQDLLFEQDEALKNLIRDRKILSAESKVALETDKSQLKVELDQVLNQGKKTQGEIALESIQRVRLAREQEAQLAYDVYSKLEPEKGVTKDIQLQKLGQDYANTIREARRTATVETVKELAAQRQTAKERLVEEYQIQFQRTAKLNELRAEGPKQEEDAIYNNYLMALSYIEKEYQARIKLGENVADAEKARRREILQVEEDQLAHLLAVQRKQLEDLKTFAGGIFDAVVSNQHGAVGQFMMAQVKGIGRTIFQNVAAEHLKGIQQTFGRMIQGQEGPAAQGPPTLDANGNPVWPTATRTSTRLGRYLSGTVFGITHTEDIQRLLANVTKENTTAEEELTQTIKDLDEAIRSATGQPMPTVMRRIPGISGIPGIPGISDNPLFNTLPQKYRERIGIAAPSAVSAQQTGVITRRGTAQGPPTLDENGNLVWPSSSLSTSPTILDNTKAETDNTKALQDLIDVLRSILAPSGQAIQTVDATSTTGKQFSRSTVNSPWSLPSMMLPLDLIQLLGGPSRTNPLMVNSGNFIQRTSAGSVDTNIYRDVASSVSVNTKSTDSNTSAENANTAAINSLTNIMKVSAALSTISLIRQITAGTKERFAAFSGLGGGGFPGFGGATGGGGGGGGGVLGSLSTLGTMFQDNGAANESGGIGTDTTGTGQVGAGGSDSWPGSNIPVPNTTGAPTGPQPASTGTGAAANAAKSGVFSPAMQKKIAAGALVAAGAYQAYSGFKQGGPKGIVSGIGGVLTAASAIPGPQQPFVLAAALVTDLISSMFEDPKKKRQEDIQNFLNRAKYVAPVQISREMDVSGNLTASNIYGLSRDTGISAFPIPIQPNVNRPDITQLGQRAPDYTYLPGRVLNTGLPAGGQPINYNVTLPISAMDSKDILARSKDIAAALNKELRVGSDTVISMQQAMFGPT